MSQQLKLYDDGSFIEWVDKETVKYIENEYSTMIWVDYEPGFFSRGRIIRSSSINRWETIPNGAKSYSIEPSKKLEIIEKIKKIYKKNRIEE